MQLHLLHNTLNKLVLTCKDYLLRYLVVKTATNLGPVYLSSDVPPWYRHLYKGQSRQADIVINIYFFSHFLSGNGYNR